MPPLYAPARVRNLDLRRDARRRGWRVRHASPLGADLAVRHPPVGAGDLLPRSAAPHLLGRGVRSDDVARRRRRARGVQPLRVVHCRRTGDAVQLRGPSRGDGHRGIARHRIAGDELHHERRPGVRARGAHAAGGRHHVRSHLARRISRARDPPRPDALHHHGDHVDEPGRRDGADHRGTGLRY